MLEVFEELNDSEREIGIMLLLAFQDAEKQKEKPTEKS